MKPNGEDEIRVEMEMEQGNLTDTCWRGTGNAIVHKGNGPPCFLSFTCFIIWVLLGRVHFSRDQSFMLLYISTHVHAPYFLAFSKHSMNAVRQKAPPCHVAQMHNPTRKGAMNYYTPHVHMP